MTQRNVMNDRTTGKTEKAGVSRKSASSAKPKRAAASNVYTTSAAAKKKAQSKARKEEERNERVQESKRVRAISGDLRDDPEYRKWRNIWWVLLVIAIIALAISWALSAFIANGTISSGFIVDNQAIISGVTMIISLAAIVGAFVIEFSKIRKIQDKRDTAAKKLSSKERKRLDKQIRAEEEAYQAQQEAKKAARKQGGLFGKKKDE